MKKTNEPTEGEVWIYGVVFGVLYAVLGCLVGYEAIKLFYRLTTGT